jgi:hypothetical protein
MKNLKRTILAVALALCCLKQTNAQSTPIKGISVKGGHNPKPAIIFSVGGGFSSPSKDCKDKAFLSNTTAINADMFLTLVRKGITEKGLPKFTAGLNFGGKYYFGGSSDFGTTPSPLAVNGQSSSIVADKGGSPAQSEFRIGVGPQVNFNFGKLVVSPMVIGEYFSLTKKEMSIVQTTQYNGQSYDFNLAAMPETKTSGFAITPKLRVQYMITDRFGLFTEGSYTTGPKLKTTVSKLIPNGSPLIDLGSYSLEQLQTGTMVNGETKSTTYSAMAFNVGFVIGLGVRKEHGKAKISELTNKLDTAANKDVIISNGESLKGWNGLTEGMVINNGGTPTTDSTGNTVYVMTFSSGCKRACSVEWTQSGAGWGCSGDQTNISCPIINYDPSTNQSARLNFSNLSFNNDGTFGIKVKMSQAELNKINGLKDSEVNIDNYDGIKVWTECSGGLQWDCFIDKSGSIISNYNGKSCTGNWSTF